MKYFVFLVLFIIVAILLIVFSFRVKSKRAVILTALGYYLSFVGAARMYFFYLPYVPDAIVRRSVDIVDWGCLLAILIFFISIGVGGSINKKQKGSLKVFACKFLAVFGIELFIISGLCGLGTYIEASRRVNASAEQTIQTTDESTVLVDSVSE